MIPSSNAPSLVQAEKAIHLVALKSAPRSTWTHLGLFLRSRHFLFLGEKLNAPFSNAEPKLTDQGCRIYKQDFLHKNQVTTIDSETLAIVIAVIVYSNTIITVPGLIVFCFGLAGNDPPPSQAIRAYSYS